MHCGERQIPPSWRLFSPTPKTQIASNFIVPIEEAIKKQEEQTADGENKQIIRRDH